MASSIHFKFKSVHGKGGFGWIQRYGIDHGSRDKCGCAIVEVGGYDPNVAKYVRERRVGTKVSKNF